MPARKKGRRKAKSIRRTTKGKNANYRPTKKGACLLYTSPSPRDAHESRMPSSA